MTAPEVACSAFLPGHRGAMDTTPLGGLPFYRSLDGKAGLPGAVIAQRFVERRLLGLRGAEGGGEELLGSGQDGRRLCCGISNNV